MKQPFQCNLQPEIQEPHRTTHTGTTTRCKTHRRNNSRTKRPQPQPPHRRGTLHRRLQPLYTEKQGFVLRLPPQNIAHATFMQPWQCVSQHPVANLHLFYARGNIKGRQWSSHSNAICNQRFKNRMELRTQEQPLVAKHIGGTILRTKRPQPQPPHRRGTFHRRLQPLTRKNTRFRVRLPPQNIAHATFMQPWQCVFAASVANLHLSTHVQHQRTTMKQPFQCNLQPEIQEPHGTTRTGTTTRCKTHEEQFAHKTTAAAAAAQTRYPSSPAATTLHGKTQGFVLRLPPQE